jgi:hypothetical protein
MNNDDQPNNTQSQTPPVPAPSETPATTPPAMPPPLMSHLQGKPRLKKVGIVVAAILLVVLAGVAVYFYQYFVEAAKKSSILSPSFEPVASTLSNEELLHTALERLLSVKELSYDVSADGVYDGSASFLFKPDEAQEMTSKSTFIKQGPMGFEAQQKAKDFYLRYTEMPDQTKDSPQGKYLNKWVLLNDSTVQNAGAGSEFIYFFVTAVSSNEAPLVIGNASQTVKDLVKPKITSGLYKIESAERVKYKELDAIKYSLRPSYKEVGKLLRSIYEKRDTSSAIMGPSYTMSSLGYDMENAYDTSKDTLTLLVSPTNAQVFEISRFINSDSFAAFSGKTVTYKNLKFDNVKMPAVPTETVPFNKFYRGE